MSFIHISGSGKPMCEALGMPQESGYVSKEPEGPDCTQHLVDWLGDHDAKLDSLKDYQSRHVEWVNQFASAAIDDHNQLVARVEKLEAAPKPEPVVIPAPRQISPEWVTRYSESDITALRRDCSEADSQIKALMMAHGGLDERVQSLETAPEPVQVSHKPLWYVIIGLVLSQVATATYLAIHH